MLPTPFPEATMRSLALPSMLLFGSLTLASCGGDTHAKVAEQGAKLMNEFVEIVAEIDDVESAEKSKPKLEALAEKMEAVAERMEKLGQPTEEEAEAMTEKMMDEDAQQKLVQEMMRLGGHPEVMEVLQEAFQKMGEASK